jgi:catechol-2,3-dioxygenase
MAGVEPELSFQVKAVTIVCSDDSRSDRFYREVLGAVLLPRDITCQWYRLGSLTITLMPNAEGRSPAEFGEHPMTMLYLEVEDLEAARKHFARHEVEVVVPSDGQMMMVADPDGLPIEVWQREIDSDETSA